MPAQHSILSYASAATGAAHQIDANNMYILRGNGLACRVMCLALAGMLALPGVLLIPRLLFADWVYLVTSPGVWIAGIIYLSVIAGFIFAAWWSTEFHFDQAARALNVDTRRGPIRSRQVIPFQEIKCITIDRDAAGAWKLSLTADQREWLIAWGDLAELQRTGRELSARIELPLTEVEGEHSLPVSEGDGK